MSNARLSNRIVWNSAANCGRVLKNRSIVFISISVSKKGACVWLEVTRIGFLSSSTIVALYYGSWRCPICDLLGSISSWLLANLVGKSASNLGSG